MGEGPIGSERLLELAASVVADWHEYLDREPTTKAHMLPRAACLYGLAMHNTNLLEFVSQSHRGGTSPLFLMPQIRTIFETGITGQWIAQVDDAASAWINDGRRQSVNLVDRLRNSSNDAFRAAADPIENARVNYAPLPSTSGQVARSFENICDEIGTGADGSYQYYKVMCGFTHPSVDLSDQYLADEQGDPPTGLHGLRAPKFDDTDVWLYLAVAGTVWAQIAFQYGAKDRILRSALRATANELGLLLDLKPTDKAWLRQNSL